MENEDLNEVDWFDWEDLQDWDTHEWIKYNNYLMGYE